MTCDEAREAFSDLYDATLSGAPLAALRRHLEDCAACRAEWTAFQRAVQAVARLGSAEPSPGFAGRVRQRVEAPSGWRRLVEWLFLPLHVKVPIQALALLLVAFAGLLIYQQSPQVRREAEVPQSGGRAAQEIGRADAQKGEQAERQALPASPRAEPDRPASPAREETRPLAKSAAPAEPRKEGAARATATGPADELYAAALRDSARQEHDRAIAEYRAFIAQHPRDARVPDARLRLADAYFARQRYAEAAAEYESLTRDFPDSPLIPPALFRHGQARLALGDPAACGILREALRRSPDAPEAPEARDALAARCP
ncbi:MAG: tetratricopeptide repeat protein [candidate division NC10 bacterium]|nr:tetratricopeptide repeat protein [candidate division NC10 bacterium]MBI3002163.1 tetratricopeptide repeat protein [candidate division NC10 bacterium]MBI4390953.1 tetratricopeptide repeat protein [candidate division NC10 bacterium]